MDKNIYGCCNNESNYINEDNVCEYRNPSKKIIKTLENDLCDMKVDLAEIKSNLIFLTQSLCNCGCLCETEEILLLSLDSEVKNLNAKLRESIDQLEALECILS